MIESKRIRDLTGQRFGRLIAVTLDQSRTHDGSARWLCRCDCGNEKIVDGRNLTKGSTRSCGCIHKERVTSGQHLDALRMAINARRQHFGCTYCGSDKHYAKGYCRSCYNKSRRGTLDLM